MRPSFEGKQQATEHDVGLSLGDDDDDHHDDGGQINQPTNQRTNEQTNKRTNEMNEMRKNEQVEE